MVNRYTVLLLGAVALVGSAPVEEDDPDLFGRIVHGEPAEFGELPYQVSLQMATSGRSDGGFHFCGAAVLNKNWIITAEHCARSVYQQKETLRVVEGALKLSDRSNPVYRVKNIYQHEYDDVTKRGDLALFELEPDPNMDKNRASHPVHSVTLPPKDFNPEGRECVVSGWGHTASVGGSAPDNLLKTVVKVPSAEMCKRMFDAAGHYPWDAETGSMICAGGEDRDACQGDSGGPLVCRADDGQYVLSGLVSWGVGCATKGIPGVYTNVRKYEKWIRDTIAKAEARNAQEERERSQ